MLLITYIYIHCIHLFPITYSKERSYMYILKKAPSHFMTQDIFQPQESYKSLNSLHLRWKHSGAGAPFPKTRDSSTQYLKRDGFYAVGGRGNQGLLVGTSSTTCILINRKANQWKNSFSPPTAPFGAGRHKHTVVWSDVADGFYVFVRRQGQLLLLHRLRHQQQQQHPWLPRLRHAQKTE